MTANKSFKPYFLSAFHCVDIDVTNYGTLTTQEISAAQNWLFKFQYKMTSCSGGNVTTGITYNGAYFRAAWVNSDFVLMELINSIVGDSRFSWLGWDTTANVPTTGTCIHHPRGDVMKISFANSALSSNSSTITWDGGVVSPISTHWVAALNNGTAERGSSGSPLLNQNKRVVGQLHGGIVTCPPTNMLYGRFDKSWTGGGADINRLSNWLDPLNTTIATTNTSRSPYITGSANVCASGGTTFTLNNPPSGFSITWGTSGNLTYVSGQGTTSFTVRANSWGDGSVQATLTNGSTSFTITKNIKAGGISYYDFRFQVYKSDGTYLPSQNQFAYGVLCPNNTYHIYLVSDFCSVTNLSWTVPSGWTVYYTYQNMISINSNSSSGGNVRVRAYTSCCGETGEVISAYFGRGPGCSGYFMALSPNPASDNVEVAILNENNESQGIESQTNSIESTSYSVSILNTYGTKFYSDKKATNKFTLSTANLKNGTYIIEVNDGKNKYYQQLVVQH
jgi:lysyl endopeptidase